MWFLELKLWNHRQKAWFIFPKLPTSNPEDHRGQKRWKVLSKLPIIISLWEWPEEPAWVLSRNNTVKEFIPHGEWAGDCLSPVGHRPTLPPSPFSRRKKKVSFSLHLVEYMYLDKMPVFLWPSPLSSVRSLWYFSQGRNPSEGWVFLFRLLIWVSDTQQAVDRNV